MVFSPEKPLRFFESGNETGVKASPFDWIHGFPVCR
jgi:hypothetical protein